jgi:hypothetical protein
MISLGYQLSGRAKESGRPHRTLHGTWFERISCFLVLLVVQKAIRYSCFR